MAFLFYCFIILCCVDHRATLGDDQGVPLIAQYFNTKGRYEEVNPHLRRDALAVNRSVLQPPSPQCREIHLTAIVRHGTRYPTARNVKDMQQLHSVVLNNSTGESSRLREILSQWTMWYTEDMDGRLAQKGVEDLKHLAVRLSKLFPSLVSGEKLRGGLIRFTSSSKHRCVNSTLSFKEGLTEMWAIRDVEFGHEVNDALMRFFDQCTRFVQEVDGNRSAVIEVQKFKQGPEIMRVREKIAERLGVPSSFITHDLAEAAFLLCSYEFAVKAVNSPWCQLFDEEDAKVMEYASDLREFWKRGYGHAINSRSSCILFHDLFRRLEKAAGENKSRRQDTAPLTSTNFASQTQRSFRTSHTMPYAANFLLVLYDCGEGGIRLQPLLNEKPLTFPGLTDQQASIPLYEEVRKHYRDLLNGCDPETECHGVKTPAEV
ncbi:multiple inositol polyphosphate phosphatase 1 isoform X2 [Fundulus heteroclitus]|uniref:multiple inositol polyphosphate phosphatase 1 isoform X2 n=1 Tax=Fundulus heteroclitus TaxID=8078 RepID=UPI00165C1005|nr:multiple inositol polyphosphate phosphatase 1 isoform X2 [Fundulus heteroclitus]